MPGTARDAADAETDARLARGRRTRGAILDTAIGIAATEGLTGLSIGRIAGALGVSKSGVFTHFGSMEELQVATVLAAAEVFRAEVVDPPPDEAAAVAAAGPGAGEPRGLLLLHRLCKRYLDYCERRTDHGGCFFVTVAVEYAARPGRVRDTLATCRGHWDSLLTGAMEEASRAGELLPGTDLAQLAFEIDAISSGASHAALLHARPGAYERARAAVLHRLRSAAADPDLLPAPAGGSRPPRPNGAPHDQ